VTAWAALHSSFARFLLAISGNESEPSVALCYDQTKLKSSDVGATLYVILCASCESKLGTADIERNAAMVSQDKYDR